MSQDRNVLCDMRACMRTQPGSANDGYGRDKKAADTPTGRSTRVHTDVHPHISVLSKGHRLPALKLPCIHTRMLVRNAHTFIVQAKRRIILIYPEKM